MRPSKIRIIYTQLPIDVVNSLWCFFVLFFLEFFVFFIAARLMRQVLALSECVVRCEMSGGAVPYGTLLAWMFIKKQQLSDQVLCRPYIKCVRIGAIQVMGSTKKLHSGVGVFGNACNSSPAWGCVCICGCNRDIPKEFANLSNYRQFYTIWIHLTKFISKFQPRLKIQFTIGQSMECVLSPPLFLLSPSLSLLPRIVEILPKSARAITRNVFNWHQRVIQKSFENKDSIPNLNQCCRFVVRWARCGSLDSLASLCAM